MMEFCKLNKNIVLCNNLTDKEVSVLVTLMRYKFINGNFAYSKRYLYKSLGVSDNNANLRKSIDIAFQSLCDKRYISASSVDGLEFISINEIIYKEPFQKMHYNDFDSIFTSDTKLDKFKLLVVYLNIIKWFHGIDGFGFPTNEKLMLECDIKSEVTLKKFQDCLFKELKMLIIKSNTFDIGGGNYTTKNFYGYSLDAIDKAIETYTTKLSWGNAKIINQETANKHRSEIMKIEHLYRNGIIDIEKRDSLKEELRLSRIPKDEDKEFEELFG